MRDLPEQRERLLLILGELGELPAAAIRPDHRIVGDLQIDSLAMLEVLERCRTELAVPVADEATAQLVHVGDLLDYLATHRPA